MNQNAHELVLIDAKCDTFSSLGHCRTGPCEELQWREYCARWRCSCMDNSTAVRRTQDLFGVREVQNSQAQEGTRQSPGKPLSSMDRRSRTLNRDAGRIGEHRSHVQSSGGFLPLLSARFGHAMLLEIRLCSNYLSGRRAAPRMRFRLTI